MDIRELKRLKPIFLNLKNEEVKPEELEKLIEKETDLELKNFLRGCKHTTERHYSEAIKWFQLADNLNDSVLLILFLSLKLGDNYLFNEYFTENLEIGDTFLKKVEFRPYVKFEDKLYPLDMEFIKSLLVNLGGNLSD